MNELILDGKIYISSKRAAEITGYAKDYVGQLCREGRVEARLVGRNWYVLKDAIKDRKFEPTEAIEDGMDDELAVKSDGNVNLPTYRGIESAKYEPEKYEAIPGLNRLAETREEKTNEDDQEAADSPVAKLNDAWTTWFSKEEERIEEKPIEIRENSSAEKVTLRRIRDYRPSVPVTMDIQAPIFDKKIDTQEKVPSKRVNKGLQRVLISGALIIVAILAILAGYVGSVLYTPIASLPKQVNSVAGVEFYTKGE